MTEANDPIRPIDEIKSLIETYLNEPDNSKKGLHFEKILDVINKKYGIKPPGEIDDLMLSTFDCNSGVAKLCAYRGHYFHRLERIDEALQCFERAYEIDPSYTPLANMARLYSYRNQYDKSIDCFKKCLELPIDDLYHRQSITYNYGFTLVLAGKYEKANEIFRSLIELYDETGEDDRDAEYWWDFGDHCLYNLSQPFEAVQKYELGLRVKEKREKAEVEMLLGLVNACNKCVSLLPDKDHNQILTYKRKANTYFNMALQLVGKMEEMSDTKLAELHFYSRNYGQARKCYESLLSKGMSVVGEEKGDVYYFLGLCHFHSENLDEAIRNFNESIHINNVAFLNIHLAQCHLKKGAFQKAEDLLDKVLYEAPFNTNALISQVFLYSDWAESIKTTSPETAVNCLDISSQVASDLLERQDSPRFLRKLTDKEISELKYAISFCSVEKSKLLKAQRGKIAALLEAKTQLADLARENNNAYFFRAGRTLVEVEKIIDDFNRNNSDRKKPLITIGLFAALLAIFMIFVGKPVIEKGYLLDTNLLASQVPIPKANIDSIFRNKRFSSINDMQEYVKTIYAGIIPTNTKLTIRPSNSLYEIKSTEIREEIIILLLSFGVVFVLLGYLTNDLKTLKVGIIQIEKSEHATLIDQIELKMAR